MKPSERIKEIKRANKSMLMSEDYKWIDAVITYLDEEAEYRTAVTEVLNRLKKKRRGND